MSKKHDKKKQKPESTEIREQFYLSEKCLVKSDEKDKKAQEIDCYNFGDMKCNLKSVRLTFEYLCEWSWERLENIALEKIKSKKTKSEKIKLIKLKNSKHFDTTEKVNLNQEKDNKNTDKPWNHITNKLRSNKDLSKLKSTKYTNSKHKDCLSLDEFDTKIQGSSLESKYQIEHKNQCFLGKCELDDMWTKL